MRTFVYSASLLVLSVVAPSAFSQQWIAPTAEELAMTSIPQVPGAPAVYLNKEELADDGAHMQSFYVRLKVLTEGGKDYATVELPYVAGASGISVDTITGRTIHPDGSIIPYTGKPYEKVVEKLQDYKVKVKVFSLPAVDVGSIIEYRYKLHTDDHWFSHPDWIIQTGLYTRKAHYMWRPTDRLLTTNDGKQTSSTVAWTPMLPDGAKIVQSTVQIQQHADGGSTQLDLDVHDVMPLPHEQYMPPMRSLAYKVMFYYTSVSKPMEYWNNQGKQWSKSVDKFMQAGPVTTATARGLVAAADTPEQKLRKIYAAVMALENTDFTRERTSGEERAEGLKETHTVDDLLTRKRGTSDQMTELFVAMSRTAGFKAYVMAVANRNQRLFLPSYLSMEQLDDLVAIVSVDGKEMFFDPGQRYCSFGRIAWRHGLAGGLRQVDGGVDLANTPGSIYKDAQEKRIADLKLDEQGVATGTITITYNGDPALAWRQRSLRGDETSLHNELRTDMERTLPGGMEIKVAKIEHLEDPDHPLVVTYDVKGAIGSPTGKRLLVPANLFEVNSKPKFPEAKRDLPVDMRYPSEVDDAVRLMLPASMVVESAPTPGKGQITGSAAFSTEVKSAGSAVTLYRNMIMGRTIFAAASYADLRDFYGKIEAKDQETLVLTRANAAKAGNGGGN